MAVKFGLYHFKITLIATEESVWTCEGGNNRRFDNIA
jgi:hypothetical protein